MQQLGVSCRAGQPEAGNLIRASDVPPRLTPIVANRNRNAGMPGLGRVLGHRLVHRLQSARGLAEEAGVPTRPSSPARSELALLLEPVDDGQVGGLVDQAAPRSAPTACRTALASRRHTGLRQASHTWISYPIHHFRGREPAGRGRLRAAAACRHFCRQQDIRHTKSRLLAAGNRHLNTNHESGAHRQLRSPAHRNRGVIMLSEQRAPPAVLTAAVAARPPATMSSGNTEKRISVSPEPAEGIASEPEENPMGDAPCHQMERGRQS